ncbi:anti sigma factor C-terminal domain-containing protein [Anaerobacillus sp. CMMVII]|uniref:anti-sigma factor C-terminal domain-containing protein n=1 Tax=Anaerobacillus sp. CMMVII TaxID=2755588 RepID=UPI0021B76CC7|nr:anti-sigma factor C-terminal domain-containing protein [Anaerobacillus sp. CMMVII]MCT8136841.1 anti sigma factor C-terminal domain-containing protein [Anaerobacillus sp. CMMVII]
MEKLKSLPTFSYIKAYISFDRDLSMGEIAELVNKTGDSGLYIAWVGIRNSEKDIQRLPLIGFEPTGTGPVFNKINEEYPHYEISEYMSASNTVNENLYENHFRDLIQFQLDHLDFFNMIDQRHFNEYYQSVKDYINQNGIYSYGIVVQGYPESILHLTNQVERFSDIYVEDIKMVLPFTSGDSNG